jgi:predicted transcriptional regulator
MMRSRTLFLRLLCRRPFERFFPPRRRLARRPTANIGGPTSDELSLFDVSAVINRSTTSESSRYLGIHPLASPARLPSESDSLSLSLSPSLSPRASSIARETSRASFVRRARFIIIENANETSLARRRRRLDDANDGNDATNAFASVEPRSPRARRDDV